MKLLTIAILILFAVAGLLWLAGCHSISGGRTEVVEERASRLVEHPDGTRDVQIGPRTSRIVQQPRVVGTGKPTMGESNGIGAIGWQEAARTVRANWMLFVLFAGLSVFGWWVYKSLALVLLGGGMALLSVVYPVLVVWLALAAVVLAVALQWRTIRGLVRGGDKAIAAYPGARDAMAAEHDPLTKAAVRAAKGKP